MTVLYNIAIFFYHLAIHIYSRFNSKAKLWVEGRQNIFAKLEVAVKHDEKIAWFHCSSMGEFEQGRPVIEAFRNEFPQFKILLTFFSPSGYEVRKDHESVDYVFYLPIDTRKNAERFINIINPKIVIFIKYEFWYHYLNTLYKRQIPMFLVSAIFRHNQHFFKWYGTLFRKILRNITWVFVQDEASQKVLDSIGLKNHSISGDTRFDRVYEIAMQVEEIPLIQQFKQDGKLFIAGSTWKEDEKLLIELINNNVTDLPARTSESSAEPQAGLKFIIAPHEIKEESIQQMISQIKYKAIRFSEAKDEEIGDAKVLIIDNMGMLSSLYQYGDIAYIGGGFGKGIHNILEAATFGMPVVFGPNYHKFREANDLIEKGGAFSIENYTELENRVRFFLSDVYVLKMASEISRNYVKNKRGATGIILDHVREFI